MMNTVITRAITEELLTLTNEYPVVTILGPRQAGKTTLAQAGLPDYAYSNLESPEVRELAQEDPKAYLAQFPSNTIIDEIQRVPELLSYIQVLVDQENGMGGLFSRVPTSSRSGRLSPNPWLAAPRF